MFSDGYNLFDAIELMRLKNIQVLKILKDFISFISQNLTGR